MAIPTAFSPPVSVSSSDYSLFPSSSVTLNPSFSIFCSPPLFPSSSFPPKLQSRISPVYCTTKKDASTKAAKGVDPKLGVSVYKPRSYEVLVADAANALSYALNDGNKRLEIEFPPLPSNISSYKGSSDEFSDANIQLVLAVVKKLQEKTETRACIVFPDKPEKRRATELFKAALDSVRPGFIADLKRNTIKKFSNLKTYIMLSNVSAFRTRRSHGIVNGL